MKIIDLMIDAALLAEVDSVAEELQTSRSIFIHEALEAALQRHRIDQLEQHQQAYSKHPVEPGEFDIWLDEQSWDDE